VSPIGAVIDGTAVSLSPVRTVGPAAVSTVMVRSAVGAGRSPSPSWRWPFAVPAAAVALGHDLGRDRAAIVFGLDDHLGQGRDRRGQDAALGEAEGHGASRVDGQGRDRVGVLAGGGP
jgi:hypothetical protein